MYKIKAGIATIEGEKHGCIIEERDDCEAFIHLANGECFNEYEIDDLIRLEKELCIDVEKLCCRLEKLL